jgi:hypothetical protein
LTTCVSRSEGSPKKVRREAVTHSGTGGEKNEPGLNGLRKVVKSDKGRNPRKDGSLEHLLRKEGETSHTTGE